MTSAVIKNHISKRHCRDSQGGSLRPPLLEVRQISFANDNASKVTCRFRTDGPFRRGDGQPLMVGWGWLVNDCLRSLGRSNLEVESEPFMAGLPIGSRILQGNNW